jgi:small subunit ribosomal protein S5
MLQRFASRTAASAARQRVASQVVKIPSAAFASNDFDLDGDVDMGPSAAEDPLFDKFNSKKDPTPRRQRMPEAARKSRFQAIAPENRGKVRRRILEEFKASEVSIEEHIPDANLLEDMQELNKETEDMAFSDEADEDELNLGRLGLLRQIVHVDKVQKVTTQGNILRFRAMVIVGNRRGCAGYAVGKGSSPPEAILRGTKLAMKNFTFVDRFDDRTLFHEVHGKWNSCTLFMRPGTCPDLP